MASERCPVDPACETFTGYPQGYRDPSWERTGNLAADTAAFGAVVIPHRRLALQAELNAHLVLHGFAGLRFEWEPA